MDSNKLDRELLDENKRRLDSTVSHMVCISFQGKPIAQELQRFGGFVQLKTSKAGETIGILHLPSAIEAMKIVSGSQLPSCVHEVWPASHDVVNTDWRPNMSSLKIHSVPDQTTVKEIAELFPTASNIIIKENSMRNVFVAPKNEKHPPASKEVVLRFNSEYDAQTAFQKAPSVTIHGQPCFVTFGKRNVPRSTRRNAPKGNKRYNKKQNKKQIQQNGKSRKSNGDVSNPTTSIVHLQAELSEPQSNELSENPKTTNGRENDPKVIVEKNLDRSSKVDQGLLKKEKTRKKSVQSVEDTEAVEMSEEQEDETQEDEDKNRFVAKKKKLDLLKNRMLKKKLIQRKQLKRE